MAEATFATSFTATEDTPSLVNFGIVQQNGDTNETLDAVWIKEADITGKNFKLYTDAAATTELAVNGSTITVYGAYYKLTGTAIGGIYIKYAANIGSADSPDSSFGVKYTVSDSVAVTSQTLTNSKTEVVTSYSLNL